MNYDAFDNWHSNDKEIRGCLSDIEGLLLIATDKLEIQELDSIKEKMELTLEQGMFWLKQNNIDRFIYDLKALSDSICEILEKKS